MGKKKPKGRAQKNEPEAFEQEQVEEQHVVPEPPVEAAGRAIGSPVRSRAPSATGLSPAALPPPSAPGTNRSQFVGLPPPSVPGTTRSQFMVLGTPGRNKVAGRDTPRSRLHYQIAGNIHDTTPIIPSFEQLAGGNSPLVGPHRGWDVESSRPNSAMPQQGGLQLWPNTPSPNQRNSGQSGMQPVPEESVVEHGRSGFPIIPVTVQSPGSRSPSQAGGYSRAHSQHLGQEQAWDEWDGAEQEHHQHPDGDWDYQASGATPHPGAGGLGFDQGPSHGDGEPPMGHSEQHGDHFGGPGSHFEQQGDYFEQSGSHFETHGDQFGSHDGQFEQQDGHLEPPGGHFEQQGDRRSTHSRAARSPGGSDNDLGSLYVPRPASRVSKMSKASKPSRKRVPLSEVAHPLSPNRMSRSSMGQPVIPSPPGSAAGLQSPSMSTMHGANMYHVPVGHDGTPIQSAMFMPAGSPAQSQISGRSQRPFPSRPHSPSGSRAASALASAQPSPRPTTDIPFEHPYPHGHSGGSHVGLDSFPHGRPRDVRAPPLALVVPLGSTPSLVRNPPLSPITPITPGRSRPPVTPIIARDFALPNRRISLAVDGTPRRPYDANLAEVDEDEDGWHAHPPPGDADFISTPGAMHELPVGSFGFPMAHDGGASRPTTPVVPRTPAAASAASRSRLSLAPSVAARGAIVPPLPMHEPTSAFKENFSDAPTPMMTPAPVKPSLFGRLGGLLGRKKPAPPAGGAEGSRKMKKGNGRVAGASALSHELKPTAEEEVAARIAEEEAMAYRAALEAEQEAQEIERAEANAARLRAEQEALEEEAARQRAAAVEEETSIILSPVYHPPEPELPQPELEPPPAFVPEPEPEPEPELPEEVDGSKKKRGGLFRGLGSKRLKKKATVKQTREPSPPPPEHSSFDHPPEPEPPEHWQEPRPPSPTHAPSRRQPMPEVEREPTVIWAVPPSIVGTEPVSIAPPIAPVPHDDRGHSRLSSLDRGLPRAAPSDRKKPQIYAPHQPIAGGSSFRYEPSIASTYAMPFANARRPATSAYVPSVAGPNARIPTLAAPTIRTSTYKAPTYPTNGHGRGASTSFVPSPPPTTATSRPAMSFAHVRAASDTQSSIRTAPPPMRQYEPPPPLRRYEPPPIRHYEPAPIRHYEPLRPIVVDHELPLQQKETITVLTEAEPQRQQAFETNEERRARLFDEGEDRRRMESEVSRREIDVWV
ncbi:hypothetical protein BKA62DRAFT_767249 [Auriculariales sp. MPI-PUGE-AT-0066]|nr:hypothetical protein BKA62DRAFT_767249 [Auriculariales sp. MPI-PUGE-AT-0066]